MNKPQYHIVIWDEAPTIETFATKPEVDAWLTEHGVTPAGDFLITASGTPCALIKGHKQGIQTSVKVG